MLSSGDSAFFHGSSSNAFGKDSRNCQLYMSQYCAKNWDKFCELKSNNTDTRWPNEVTGDGVDRRMTAGEIIIRNTAHAKYLQSMAGCKAVSQPFDPTVPSSPMVTYYTSESDNCVPVYAVNPQTVDGDVVMDKLLGRPHIAPDILINIYNNAKRNGSLAALNGTKLGQWFQANKRAIENA
ncbi:hypothetical protein HN747_05380 [archaeon]|nr:hypothetical protein [archaeon]